jgi:hypothetical protein
LKVGAGEAAAAAALAGLNVDFARTVAPTTPPTIIDAATADPKSRVRVLFMHTSSEANLRTALESGVSFGPAGPAFLLLPPDLGLGALVIWKRPVQPDAVGAPGLIDLGADDIPPLPQVHDAAMQLCRPALRRYPHTFLL